LKILLLYYEPQPSGQTTHVLSLARGLAECQHDLTVVLPDHLKRPAAAFRRLGVQTIPLLLPKVMWNPQAIGAVHRLVRQSDYDIVHVHGQEAGMPARLVARLAGARAIFYTPQTIDIRRARLHRLYALVERSLASITDVIISVNGADRARLIRWGIPAHKVVTVPNGIEVTEQGNLVDIGEVRKSLGFHSEQLLVMQVGRLSAQKNPAAFVEGAAHVVEKVAEAQFALIGDGPLRDDVAARIHELGLAGCVHLLGWRDNASQLMAAADVVTLTSRWEGTPYALLEAMAWSRPVVATNVNGCLEVVAEGNSGFLVQPGNAITWSQRVTELLKDPKKAALMGRAGRKRVEEAFTLRRMITRIEGLYQQAVRS
jgi:glycosyltransferase involved in cell wall biosynthesis